MAPNIFLSSQEEGRKVGNMKKFCFFEKKKQRKLKKKKFKELSLELRAIIEDKDQNNTSQYALFNKRFDFVGMTEKELYWYKGVYRTTLDEMLYSTIYGWYFIFKTESRMISNTEYLEFNGSYRIVSKEEARLWAEKNLSPEKVAMVV
jgi:hypothetical protein